MGNAKYAQLQAVLEMARRHLSEQLREGDAFVGRSIIDGRFDCRIAGTTTVGDRPAIVPTVKGRAWITGEDDGLNNLGAIASSDPWRALHKMANGQTYADMPALRGLGERRVRGVRPHRAELCAALLVEAPHEHRVARPRLGRRDVFGSVAFPQAAGVAERAHSGVGGDAGAGHDDQMHGHDGLAR